MRNHHSKYGVFIASCTLFSARLRALCPRSCASAVSLTVEKHGERDTLLVYYVCIWYEGCRSVPLPSTLSTLEDLEKSRVGRRARGRTKRPAEFEKATTNRWDINLKLHFLPRFRRFLRFLPDFYTGASMGRLRVRYLFYTSFLPVYRRGVFYSTLSTGREFSPEHYSEPSTS